MKVCYQFEENEMYFKKIRILLLAVAATIA
jgi:hypothetical protein